MNAKINATPAEIVLGNRIEHIFPARLRDAMLPGDIDELVDMVRIEEEVPNLDVKHAKHWVIAAITKIEQEEMFDGTERQLMLIRLDGAFQ